MSNKQYIETDGSETKYYSDRGMTVLHREDGPAREWRPGCKAWYINGKLHREDGPAIEWGDGSKAWYYVNGKLHREDGPAKEYANGEKAWYINNKLHREDGPAKEDANGYKAWYLNGERLTAGEFKDRMSPILELTLDEIAEKFGVSVDKLKIKA